MKNIDAKKVDNEPSATGSINARVSQNPASNFQSAFQDIQAHDFTIGTFSQSINNSLKESPEFFERKNLERFEPKNFPKIIDPQYRYHLTSLTTIQTNRVLVISGSHEDKADLVFHFAECLREVLSNRFRAQVSIYEWSQTSPSSLFMSFRGEGDEELKSIPSNVKVFILPRLLPQHINNDLLGLIDSAQHGQCYVLAYTDIPSQQWVIPSYLQGNILWEPIGDIYEGKSLTRMACDHLIKSKVLELKKGNEEIILYLNQKIIKNLKTATRTRDLIGILSSSHQPITHASIDLAIETAKQDRKIPLKKWFLDDLDQHDQFLIIGITLFHGLFIDQFFTILEQVIFNVWQKREPSLSASDYGDLIKFGNYYKLSAVSYTNQPNEILIELNQRDDAKVLLEIAWESHQRQIINALNEVVKIVQRASYLELESPAELELFSDKVKASKFRANLKETLINIGLISPDFSINSIQSFLLSLAQGGDFYTKNIVAETLAAWYDYDASKQQVLDIFRRFYRYSTDFPVIDASNLDKPSLKENVGSTLAITLGYVIAVEELGSLSPDLYAWLYTISSSRSKHILAHFGTYTLKYTIKNHIEDEKIQWFIKELAQQNFQQKEYDLGESLASNIAQIYSESEEPKECEKILILLDSWVKEAENNYPRRIPVEGSSRDHLLRVVALTYGELSINPESNSLDQRKALEYLTSILQNKSRHPLVRNSVTIAICNRAKKDFPFIEPSLKSFLSLLTYDFQDRLVEALKEIYIKERKALKGGDTFYEKDGYKYSTWIDSIRPLTAPEKGLLKWLDDERDPVAQRFSTRAFFEFAAFLDEPEHEFVLEKIEEREKQKKSDKDFIREANEASNPLPFIMTKYFFYACIATFYRWPYFFVKPVYTSMISNLLPEAYKLDRKDQKVMEFVLSRWKEITNQDISNEPTSFKHNLRTTSDRLGAGLYFAKHPWRTFLLTMPLLVLILVFISNQIARFSLGGKPNSSIQQEPTSIQPNPDFPIGDNASVLPGQTNLKLNRNNTDNSNYETLLPRNHFYEITYPLEECGDESPSNYSPSGGEIYYFYPVYIDYSEYNYSVVKESFCRDAYYKAYGELYVIQVASFSSFENAELFSEFMRSKFGSGEVGEPRIIGSPE